MNIAGLAKAINDHNGMEGAELEAFTFYVAAGLASVLGHKEAADHFDARCKASWAKHKAGK